MNYKPKKNKITSTKFLDELEDMLSDKKKDKKEESGGKKEDGKNKKSDK